MRAAAAIVAELGGAGRTVVRVAAGAPPLSPRVTGRGEVYLAATAGGPLGGDELCIDVQVGPGAELTVRTVAACVVLPGAGGCSRLSVRAAVGQGGRLAWLPEPTVAAAGCDHITRTVVELAAGARLVLREELIGGRHGEPPGDLRSSLTVSRAGAPVLAQTLTWGGTAIPPGIPARAVGSLLVVGPPDTRPAAAILGPWAAVMPLAHPGAALVSVLGADARSVRVKLDMGLAAAVGLSPGRPCGRPAEGAGDGLSG